MLRRATNNRESGQSLIELIVAMVLIAIVGGMAMTFLTDAFSTQESANSSQKVQAIAADAAEQLGNDLRQAYSEDRGPDKVADLDTLRRGIVRGVTIRDVGGAELDVRDIVIAKSNHLMFRADVIASNKGVECVEYDARSVTAGLLRVVYKDRALRNGADCKGSVLSPAKLLIPPRAP